MVWQRGRMRLLRQRRLKRCRQGSNRRAAVQLLLRRCRGRSLQCRQGTRRLVVLTRTRTCAFTHI